MNGLVGGAAVAFVISVEVAVRVPFSVAIDLYKSNAPLDEAPGHQAFRAVGPCLIPVDTVHVAGGGGLGAEVHEVGRLRLHPVREFEALDAPK